MEDKKTNIEKRIDWTNKIYLLLILFCILLILFPPIILKESWKEYIDNILNGSIAIIPATLIVMWQVRKENKALRIEQRNNHLEELKKIERNHNEDIKKSIYELLAISNEFPNLFQINYRISIIKDDGLTSYDRILQARDSISAFKEEFHKKSISLQSNLIYLSNVRAQQNNLAQIIDLLVKIKLDIQKLERILTEEKIKGGLGYSERDYEKAILDMSRVKECFKKLPPKLAISPDFMNMVTKNIDYFDCAIRCAKQFLDEVYEKNNKLTVNLLKDINNVKFVSLLNELKEYKKEDEALRDILKIWALRNHTQKRDYSYLVNGYIEIKKEDQPFHF